MDKRLNVIGTDQDQSGMEIDKISTLMELFTKICNVDLEDKTIQASNIDRGLIGVDLLQKFVDKISHGDEESHYIEDFENYINDTNRADFHEFIYHVITSMKEIGIVIDIDSDEISFDLLYVIYQVLMMDLHKTLAKAYLGSVQMGNVRNITESELETGLVNCLTDVDLSIDEFFDYIELGNIDYDLVTSRLLTMIKSNILFIEYDLYFDKFIHAYINTDSFMDSCIKYLKLLIKSYGE